MATKRTGELAQLMGVTPQTIRTWIKQGKLPHHTTPNGQLYFTDQDIQAILGDTPSEKERTWAHYTRSSSGNKNLLTHQKEQLQEEYGTPTHHISDNGSGLNEQRKGLQRLITLARNGDITDIAITHPDRLTRFGYTYLQELFATHGVTIHILNPKTDNTPEQELMNDFMSLIASFSGRFYRLRTPQNQRKLLEKALQESNKK